METIKFVGFLLKFQGINKIHVLSDHTVCLSFIQHCRLTLLLLYYISLHDLSDSSCHMNSPPIPALTEISTIYFSIVTGLNRKKIIFLVFSPSRNKRSAFPDLDKK